MACNNNSYTRNPSYSIMRLCIACHNGTCSYTALLSLHLSTAIPTSFILMKMFSISLQFQVTADGSFNCADNPGEQEATVAQLLYCETVSALLLLKAGGSFVLKTFTTFECHTLCLIYLLACCFSEVEGITSHF